MMMQKDFYQVLGIEKDASDDEIKKKYYALAKKFHPDKNADQEAEEKFKEINTAYEALKDADARQTYAIHKRGEEMEKRFSNQASNYTFFTSPFGPSTRSSFGMGFSAHDLHDIFGKAFRGRNKENAQPDPQKPSGGANDPNVSFTFSFFEEPRGPPKSKFEEPEDIFGNFFQDPFFMDSFPFSDGNLHSSSANERSSREHPFHTSRETPQQPSQSSSSSHDPKKKGTSPSSSKPPPSSSKSSRPPSAKASSAGSSRPQKESRKKGDEERMYDWQENLFGSNKKAREETKTESTTKEVPDDIKLTCNYCSKKFYPEALDIHEPVCQEKYYGRGSSGSKPSSSSSAKDDPKPSSASAGSSSSSFGKNDILRDAYGQARKEFAEKYISPPKPPSPPPDFLLCEWCGQSFSDGVAKYHIPFCGRKHAADQKTKGKTRADSNNQSRPPRATSGSSARATSAGEARRPPPDYKSSEDPLLRPTYRSSHVAPPRPSAPPSLSRATGSGAYDRPTSSAFTNVGSGGTTGPDEPFAFRPAPRTTFIAGRPSGSTTRIRYVPAAVNTRRSHQI